MTPRSRKELLNSRSRTEKNLTDEEKIKTVKRLLEKAIEAMQEQQDIVFDKLEKEWAQALWPSNDAD